MAKAKNSPEITKLSQSLLSLKVDDLFLFYTGEDERLYTPLTGENLNKPLIQLNNAIGQVSESLESFKTDITKQISDSSSKPSKFDPTLEDGYSKDSIIFLDNGIQVISTSDGNKTDPNQDMTGWEIYLNTKRIVDDNGRSLDDILSENKSIKDFGVISSETLDQTELVRSYHNYCNANNYDASYKGLKYLKIKSNARIIVSTNLDFSGCEIILDDPHNQTPVTYRTYLIDDESTPLETVTGSIDPNYLKYKSTKPTYGLFDGSGYACIFNDKPMIDRDKTGTTQYIQSFWLLNGEAVKPLSSDLSSFSSNNKVVYRKASKNRISISNICLREDGWTGLTFLYITRNQVDINGFTLNITDKASDKSLDILMTVHSAGDVSFNDIDIRARPYLNSGTYGLSLRYAAEIIYRNVKGLTGNLNNPWGITGCNYVNGLYVFDSHLNRLDIHAMGFNVYMIRGSLRDQGMMIGNGGGVFSIKGTEVYMTPAFQIRTDYGNHYEYCLVEVEDVNWTPTPDNDDTKNNSLVNLGGAKGLGGNLNVKVPDIMINDITINSLDDHNQFICRLLSVKVRSNQAGSVRPPNYIDVTNIHLPFRARWSIDIDFQSFDIKDWSNDAMRVTLSNFYGSATGSYINTSRTRTGLCDSSSVGKDVPNKTYVRLTVENVGSFGLDTKHPKISQMNIRSTNIYTIQNAVKPTETYIYDCRLVGNTTYQPVAKLLGDSTGTGRVIIRNMTIGSGSATASYDISNATSLQGCEFNSDNILPANVTIDSAFMGWKK